MKPPDTRLIENKDALYPQARVGVPSLDNGNAWSAILGAIGGAGTVLFIAMLVLLWRKPRRRDLPLLAPMDVTQNVSIYYFQNTVFKLLRSESERLYFRTVVRTELGHGR